MSALEKLENLFTVYVPMFGKAETVGGEIIRAVVRIGYRYMNDGDCFWQSYGVETCGSSMLYLCKFGAPFTTWENQNVGVEYGVSELEKLYEVTVDYLDNHKKLFEQKNNEDSRTGFSSEANERYAYWLEEENEEDEY